MNKSVLNEIKASYKRLVEDSIKEHLKYNVTIEEIRHSLLTGDNWAFIGLNEKIDRLNNETLSELEIQVLKNEIEVSIELLNKYCQPTKLVASDAKYNGEMKSYSYVVTYEYNLITKETGYSEYKLIQKENDCTNFKINNKKVKSFTVDIEHKIFIDIQELEVPENNYNKICNFIIGKYGDKEKYFFLDELMKELKQLFKVTQKEVKEIILNKLIDENKINLIKIPLSGHKAVRFYKNGIYYSVDRFIIPEKVFQNTFKAY